MRSILQTDKKCYLCGRISGLERHHVIHGTANRRKAEKMGLWIWLCPECHRNGPEAVHRNATLDRNLKKIAQKRYEYTHTRAEWMREIGRNYIDE